MPEFFNLIAPFAKEFGSNMFNQIGSNAIQSMFSRGDFAFTKNLTDVRQQVRDMVAAGLNPALAYGQIHSPQAQSLGNYQSDYAGQSLARAQKHLAEENIETQDAQQEYLSALAFKNRMEGMHVEFLNSHQEEDWQIGYEGRQMDNVHKNLLNTNQFIQNRIAEIDWKAKPYILAGQLTSLMATVDKVIAEADSIRARLPFELANIAASTKAFLSTVRLNGSQMYLNQSLRGYYEQMRRNLTSTKEGIDLQNAYESWLSNGGTDFTRKRTKEFQTALLNSLLGLIPNFNFTLGLYGLSGKNKVTPSDWKTYGPGRDHLGH